MTIGLVVVAVTATLWVVMALPSRRRARAAREESKAKAQALVNRQRAEMRAMPIRFEQEQRQEAYAQWKRAVDAAVDPMVNAWLTQNPDYGQVPQHVLDELFNFAQEKVGPEPPR